MKVNKKQFNKVFKNMDARPVKEWRITTSKVIHRDKKKSHNKYKCRKKVL